jgi:hypothetical protein
MRGHLKQIRWCLLFLTILLGCAAGYNLVRSTSVTEMSHGIFLGIVFFISAAVVWRYYQAVMLFLENESASNLDRTMERQSICWITLSFFGLLYVAVHFIFR